MPTQKQPGGAAAYAASLGSVCVLMQLLQHFFSHWFVLVTACILSCLSFSEVTEVTTELPKIHIFTCVFLSSAAATEPSACLNKPQPFNYREQGN